MIVGAIKTYQELKLSFFTSHNHGTTLEKVPADHSIAISGRSLLLRTIGAHGPPEAKIPTSNAHVTLQLHSLPFRQAATPPLHRQQRSYRRRTAIASNEEHIEALLKDLTPSPPSPSPWQAEVITIEDDAAPADPITIDDGTESDCNQQQKEANLEDVEKMKVEEDDSDSEDEGSLGQPALPQEQTFASLGALESYLHDFAVPLGFDFTRSKWYGRKKEASGKMSRLYFAAVVVVSKIASARQINGATRSRPSASGKWLQ
ncbi:hypothetical protein E4U09_002653 [Claviceps aff. purpurea]|uniref:Uncharacterized protein n=1 Tax=Claviceps aff. purpurea TaxID=1967640 RepID=A0A9P7U1J5_9HYPO|nr:hypothetical protein E4U09_002653 [Claviceps aff. purpurea]